MMKSKEINIYDLNYILFSSFRHKVKNPRPFVWCFAYFIYESIKSFFSKHAFRYPSSNALLVYAPSVNNQRTTATVIAGLKEENYTLWVNTDGELPQGWLHLYSLLRFGSFVRYYRKQNVQDKELIRFFFGFFFSTIGRYMVADRFLSRNAQIKMILMPNDHNQTNRCIIELAHKYGIQTIYCQHASVTEKFPPLHFDYSFLDGLESFEKYKTVGDMKGKVFLSGSPRYDELMEYAMRPRVDNTIGIGLGEADSLEKALSLCSYIQENSDMSIVVRPHPRTEPNFPSELFCEKGIVISYPSKESSLSFLSKISFLIANESGIHLDAALMRRKSILFNMSGHTVMDWYGYLKQGLMQQCDSFENVLHAITEKEDDQPDTAKYYYAAWNTPYEGKVGFLISQLVQCCLKGENVDSLIDSIFAQSEQGFFIYR